MWCQRFTARRQYSPTHHLTELSIELTVKLCVSKSDPILSGLSLISECNLLLQRQNRAKLFKIKFQTGSLTDLPH